MAEFTAIDTSIAEGVVVATRAKLAQGSSTVFVPDASLSEKHAASTEVTEHPVEQGLDASDNRRVRPREVSVDWATSSRPVTAESSDDTRASTAHGVLLGAIDSGALFTLTTGLRVYDNMVMTALNVQRDKSTGKALRFSATFKEVRVVQAKRIKLTAAARAQPNKPQGGKVKQPEQPELLRSGLKRGVDALSRPKYGTYAGSSLRFQ